MTAIVSGRSTIVTARPCAFSTVIGPRSCVSRGIIGGVGSVLLLIVIIAGIVFTAWALTRWLSNRPQEHPGPER